MFELTLRIEKTTGNDEAIAPHRWTVETVDDDRALDHNARTVYGTGLADSREEAFDLAKTCLASSVPRAASWCGTVDDLAEEREAEYFAQGRSLPPGELDDLVRTITNPDPPRRAVA